MNKIPQKGGWVGSKKILSAGAEPVVRTYISPAIRPRSVSAAKPLFLYQKSSISYPLLTSQPHKIDVNFLSVTLDLKSRLELLGNAGPEIYSKPARLTSG